MLPREQQRSRTRYPTPITHPTRESISEDREESRRYFQILTFWDPWVLRSSSENRILQMWMWLPCDTIWSPHPDNSLPWSNQFRKLHSCSGPLFTNSLNHSTHSTFIYLILTATSWSRYVNHSHFYSRNQLIWPAK